MKKTIWALIVSTVFLMAGSLFAEEPLRGRLPDGRAFRTDAQGVQIIDYIAELELSIESLNRRIKGLEYELELKQNRLDRIGDRGESQDVLVERDLLGSSSKEVAGPPQPEFAVCPRCPEESPRSVQLTSLQSERDALAQNESELNKKIEQLNLEIEQLRSQNRSLATQTTALQGSQQQVLNCGQQVDSLNQQLELKSKEITGCQAQLADYRTKLASLTAEANTRDQQIRSVSYQQTREAATSRSSGPQVRAQYSAERMRAMNTVRSQLKSDMNKLRGLVDVRSNKYSRYKNSGLPVSFQLTPLVSDRDKNISYVKQRISTAQNMRELSLLQQDIRQIQDKVRDDIALMDRLSKRG